MSAIEVIGLKEEDFEMEESQSEHSEHSEQSESVDEIKQIMMYIENACKFLPKKELIEVSHMAVKALAEFNGEVRKVKSPPSAGALKHQAWIDWVLARCKKEGWAEFSTKTKKYAAAGLTADGEIVFSDTLKPFNRSHAIAYSSMVRETAWYAEFEASYVPNSVEISSAQTERERKAAEKEAEKVRKAEEKARKAEEAQAKKIEAQRIKDEKAQKKLDEKAASEKAAAEKLASMKPIVVAAPAMLVKPVVAAKAAPVPILKTAAAPPVPMKKKSTWIAPPKGELAWRTIDGVQYACDCNNNLFLTDANGQPEFVGRVDPTTQKLNRDLPEMEDDEN